MGKLGRWLRRNILNPVKSIFAKTPLGKVIEGLVPGALDPAVNLFAKIEPPVIAAPPTFVAPTVQAPQMVSIPTQHLQTLVAEAREAGRLRAELAQYRVAPPQLPLGVGRTFPLW